MSSSTLATAAFIAAKARAARRSTVPHSRVGVGFFSVRMSLHQLVGDTFSGVGVAPRDGVHREHLTGQGLHVELIGEVPQHGEDLLFDSVGQGGVEVHGRSLSQIVAEQVDPVRVVLLNLAPGVRGLLVLHRAEAVVADDHPRLTRDAPELDQVPLGEPAIRHPIGDHSFLSQPRPFPALYLYPTTYLRSSKAPARGNDPRFAYAGCPVGLRTRGTPAGAPRGPGRSSSGSPPGPSAGPGSACTCPW